jgi:SNF2 family DNA or RNA helicase
MNTLQMLYKTQPYAKQLEAWKKAQGRYNFAYFMEMGTGKSKVLIDDIVDLKLHNLINAVVIVAPKGCYTNWTVNEIPKHLPNEIVANTLIWKAPSLQGKGDKKQCEEFLSQKDLEFSIKFLLINIEALSNSTSLGYISLFLQKHKCLMAIDESTTIRNVSSERFKNARALGKLAKYRRILTGTPIANRPLDIFAQCAFLDPKLLDFPNYHAFKHYYADIRMISLGTRRSYPKILGYRRLEDLTKRLDQFSYRVLKKDCLDLPDKVYVTRYVEATNEQKKLYNQMAKLMVAEHSNGDFSTAQIVLTKVLRLQSILCGHLKMDNDEMKHVSSNRVDSLLELLEETSGKVIIWCLYKEDIALITKELDKGNESYVEYHGGIGEDARKEALFRFKNDPDYRLFIGTQATGGMGLTLTEATTVIYFSQGYDLEKRLQSEDRAHRIGQKETVTYVDMVVKDSVDEKIVESLKSKQNLANLILNGLSQIVGEV